jgi:catechol 2,3-dioxygenase-like lactoylglutathione lyase family enzyme
MNLTIHYTFRPADDPDRSLACYRDTLGFEVRNDVGYGGMRWITVGPPDQPQTSLVLEPADQAYGVRDCAFRDPAGNLVRINQVL